MRRASVREGERKFVGKDHGDRVAGADAGKGSQDKNATALFRGDGMGGVAHKIENGADDLASGDKITQGNAAFKTTGEGSGVAHLHVARTGAVICNQSHRQPRSTQATR